MIALPLKLEGCQIRDATGKMIALVRGDMTEYRAWGAEIIASVNMRVRILNDRDKLRQTRADLLAAAKLTVSTANLYGYNVDDLKAAIAKAEESMIICDELPLDPRVSDPKMCAFINRVRSLFNIDSDLLPELDAKRDWPEFRDDPPRYFISAGLTQQRAIWREVEKRQ